MKEGSGNRDKVLQSAAATNTSAKISTDSITRAHRARSYNALEGKKHMINMRSVLWQECTCPADIPCKRGQKMT